MYDWPCIIPVAVVSFMVGMTVCMTLDYIFEIIGRWMRRKR